MSSLPRHLWTVFAAVLATGWMFASQATTPDTPALVPVKLKGIDYSAQMPDQYFQGRRIDVAPVAVAFSKTWDPRSFGNFGLEAADVQTIRGELAAIATASFTKMLASTERSRTTTLASPDTPELDPLELKIRIFDVYVNAPVRSSLSPLYTLVFESGEMSVEIELQEKGSGKLLAVLRDRYRDPGNATLTLSNEISQRSAAKQVFGQWAEQFSRLLRSPPHRP